MTLAKIKAIRIVGNAHSDRILIDMCDDFIHNQSNPMEERIKALQYLSEDIMGLGMPDVTEEDILIYMTESGL